MLVRALFILLFIFSYANSFEIKEDKNTYNFDDFKVYYDKENQKTITDFIEDKSFFKKSENTNVGIKKHLVWTYGKIVNKTSTIKQLILTNPRAGVDFIDVYVLKDNKIVAQHILGDMNPQNTREILYRKSSFELILPKNGEYEIIIRYKSFGAIDINLIVQDEHKFISDISKESSSFGFVAGFAFLIIIIMLYINQAFPSKVNIIFFFIVLSSLTTQLSVSGVLYQIGLNPYINTIISWSFGNIGAALIGIFPIFYFNLQKLMPKSTVVLYFLSFLIVLLSFVFLFYPLKNDLLYLAPYANITFFIISFLLIYISLYLTMKKIDGYKIYLLGNSLFLMSVLYFILGLLGLVPTDNLFYLSLGIGLFLNILCLGLLIISNLLKMKNEKDDALILLNEYSKLSSIGQSMINLSHQWKEPLNHIYYAINNIQAAKEFKDPDLENIIDNSLEQIKQTANHMTNTGENFLNIYQDKSHIENVNIINSIKTAFIIFKKQLDELDILFIIDADDKYFIFTNKYLLANIFVIIFENIIKIFQLRKIQNPQVYISITQDNNIIKIIICDNAGGIKEFPINSIFEKDLTSSESTGLGLFLAKTILKLKLNGDIKADNLADGACFTITL